MKKLALIVLVTVCYLAAPASAAAPARLLVTASEYQLTLSRASIKAGTAVVQLANNGEDAHDLRLQRVGTKRIFKIATVQPSDVGELQTTFAAGTYKLWCSLPGHAALGMRTQLVVKK